MRRLLSIACALLLSSAAFGQQVRSREAGLDELRMLLEQTGYKAFGFDLREFLADRYDVTVRVKEYADGRDLECDRVFYLRSNKLMLTDFPAVILTGVPVKPTASVLVEVIRCTPFFRQGQTAIIQLVPRRLLPVILRGHIQLMRQMPILRMTGG